jgi:hypothetical protein
VDVCIGDIESVLLMSWGKRRELMGLEVPLPLAENPMNNIWRQICRKIFHLPLRGDAPCCNFLCNDLL